MNISCNHTLFSSLTHTDFSAVPLLSSDPAAQGNAATGAQGLRKDTGKFDWKQTLLYGKPALTLRQFSPGLEGGIYSMCVCVRAFNRIYKATTLSGPIAVACS